MPGSRRQPDEPVSAPDAMDALGQRQSAIRECDFRESRRFSADQMQEFERDCGAFCKQAGQHLSSYLGTNVALEVTGTEQAVFEIFLASVADPPLLARFHCPPLSGVGVLEVPMPVAYAALAIMTGGTLPAPLRGGTATEASGAEGPGAEDLQLPERPPTDLELGLVARLSQQILVGLKAVWSKSIDFNPEVPGVTTSAKSLDVVPPTEVVMVVRLNVTCGDTEGLAAICFSATLARGLAGWGQTALDGASAHRADSAEESARLAGVPLPVVARLGSTTVTLRDVLGLSVGTVLPLDQHMDEPMLIQINGLPKFRGNAGVHQGRLAVRIADVVG